MLERTAIEMSLNKSNLFGLFSNEFFQNPLPTYAHLRDIVPVCGLPSSRTSKTWLITRYDDCKNILFNEKYTTKDIYHSHTQKELKNLNTALCVLGNNLFTKDDAIHTRLRNVVNRRFLPDAIAHFQSFVETQVEHLLQSQLHKHSVDFIRDFADPLILLILSQLFGTEPEETKKLIHLIETIFKKSASYSVLRPEVAENLVESQQFIELIRLILLRKSLGLQDDLLSHLLIASNERKELSEQELIAKLVILIEAAHASTINFIPNALYTLLTNPSQWEMLKADPLLLDSATEECLRCVSPISTTAPRWARERIILHGTTIEKSDMILLSLTSANHDERFFEQPELFNIRRSPNRHLAFGNGPHVCLGQHLARLAFKSTLIFIIKHAPLIKIAKATEEIKWNSNFAIRGISQLQLSFNFKPHLKLEKNEN